MVHISDTGIITVLNDNKHLLYRIYLNNYFSIIGQNLYFIFNKSIINKLKFLKLNVKLLLCLLLPLNKIFELLIFGILIVLKQDYTPEVYDEFVIEGNSAVLKCVVPTHVKDFIEVKSWIKEPNTVIERSMHRTYNRNLKQSK